MQTTGNEVDLTANARTANLLAGNILEFITVASQVNIFAVASAAAVNIEILADSDVAVSDSEIIAIGTSLDKSQHLIDSFAVSPGTRLALFLRTTTATATTDVLWAVEVLPL